MVDQKKIPTQSKGFKAFCREVADSIKQLFRDPRVLEVIRWCMPALILGIIARVLLTIAMPFGYVQFDTPDFLMTTARFLQPGHDLVIHNKKTFLGPIVFTLPFLQPFVVPIVVIPFLQHLLGLVMIIAVGGLVRFWFTRWKWFIIPITVATTLNPSMLWYEHALLAEFHYIFCVVAVMLAGTVFCKKKSKNALIFLLVALFFTAGSRPEGKLFFGVAFALVALVYFGQWKLLAKRMALTAVVAAGTFAITNTGQAGTLLYATLLPLAPETPKLDPSLGPVLAPLRERAIAEGPTVRTDLVTRAKEINQLVGAHYKERKLSNPQIAAICKKLAKEAAFRHPELLWPIAVNKYLMALEQPTNAGYSSYVIHDKQAHGMTRKPHIIYLSERLTGTQLNNYAEAFAFCQQHYREVPWFDPLQNAWDFLTRESRLPSKTVGAFTIPGVPFFYIVTLIGMAAALIRGGPVWKFQVSFLLTFSFIWFIVILTGVGNPRYRFVFEPVCVIYCILLLDFIASLIRPNKTALSESKELTQPLTPR